VSFGAAVVATAIGNMHWGAGVGAVFALFGLFIVSVGYGLADVFGDYVTTLMLTATVPIAAFFWGVAEGHTWLWAAGATILLVVLTGVARGIMRHASASSREWLVGNIIRSFIPGA
jgi:hypothetical protein